MVLRRIWSAGGMERRCCCLQRSASGAIRVASGRCNRCHVEGSTSTSTEELIGMILSSANMSLPIEWSWKDWEEKAADEFSDLSGSVLDMREGLSEIDLVL